ncbi:phosphotransferase family protein [Micromonospora endolithica]|uniref:Aminoglycoside phosphotransferase n=1 Tax=Micromonospora endolithica TaxID=230091 RepID=A0A3A9ZQH3_9ACTN|nr:phosphotransferase [Micromonospora endolithica]RKN50421.1 aminoglycoside phosphotransferase [Micromonospora endolithica]TWJ20893.1 Ser/Thr protein kinase RdoA (MazF antagonist) [Micromonospora endolithica]
MSRPSNGGRFSASAMAATLRHIADRIGIPADDARLLNLTNNAVFALPAAGIVVRISRARQLSDRAFKVAALGTWFAEIDAPTIRLQPGLSQPVDVDGTAATVWTYLPPLPPAPTLDDLGHVLRQFHHLPSPAFALPVWDPVGDAQRRIADAEGLSDHHRDILLTWCDRLSPRIEAVRDNTSPGLIHGDAHPGNLLRDINGSPVLCDFDATTLGPRQVDLVAVPVGEARFRRHGQHRRLAAAYGYDVTTDPHWPLLREARELKMIVAAVPRLHSSPGVADEFALRLRTITSHDDIPWTPFADLPRQ